MRSLPFVEADSVRPFLASRQVLFRIKTGRAFDLPATRKTLADAGYDGVEVVTEPKG